MLIAIVGPPQAGKHTLANHLVTQHQFTRVHITSSAPPPLDKDANSLYFSSSSEFLDHATQTWRVDYVTTDLKNKLKLQEFSKRPFVAVVAVDAPIGVRFKRAVASATSSGLTPPTLEEFVASDDLTLHGPLPLDDDTSLTASPPTSFVQLSLSGPPATPTKQSAALSPTTDLPASPSPSPHRPSSPLITRTSPTPSDPLSTLLPLASTTLLNPYTTTHPFLTSLSLPTLAATLRPPWDSYFMLLASLASLRSNCMKRRVGAVLVREKRVVSTGYNGTPRGVKNCGEGGCGRCNSHGNGFGGEGEGKALAMAMGEGLNECLCLHAEENALLEAGRERVSGGGTEGAVLYCNTCPCLRCTVKIVQCGVTEVVYSLSYSMDSASRRVMEEAGVGLRQIEMPEFPC